MSETPIPVVEVTVQEDRALVRREGSVTLSPGRTKLRIEGVAPVLVDKSLTAELLDPAADGEDPPRVRAVRASRWSVTEDAKRPAALAELQATLRERQAEHRTLVTRRSDIEAERILVLELMSTTVEELSIDSGYGRTPQSGAPALDDLEQRLAVLGRERCELHARIQRQERDIADLQQLEAASQTVEAHAAAAIDVELHNPAEQPLEVRLRVDYLVPGALWRPWHRARLDESDDGARVRLSCEGCVWQATGEDWTDVQLVLSTERPSLGLTPPVLHTDQLALRKKGPAVQVQTRDQTIHTAGLGSESSDAEAADELPGIDDGGEAQLLRARARTTIPGDGRPHRVPLFEVDGPAQLELRCIPELAAAVILRSEQTNTASHPLLAGPVDLVRQSGLVGRTSILYIAPGERFELGWGPDNGLRVVREVELLEWERKTLSSWTRKPRKVRIKLSNLAASPRTVSVCERIAVSEIDKVKVELQVAQPRTRPDDDGLLKWDVRLPGFGRHELSVEWALVVHDDVQGI